MQAADCTALPPWELTTSELEREISTPLNYSERSLFLPPGSGSSRSRTVEDRDETDDPD